MYRYIHICICVLVPLSAEHERVRDELLGGQLRLVQIPGAAAELFFVVSYYHIVVH